MHWAFTYSIIPSLISVMLLIQRFLILFDILPILDILNNQITPKVKIIPEGVIHKPRIELRGRG